jgi:hypothetical protein
MSRKDSGIRADSGGLPQMNSEEMSGKQGHMNHSENAMGTTSSHELALSSLGFITKVSRSITFSWDIH